MFGIGVKMTGTEVTLVLLPMEARGLIIRAATTVFDGAVGGAMNPTRTQSVPIATVKAVQWIAGVIADSVAPKLRRLALVA
jgi:hypothetical protein